MAFIPKVRSDTFFGLHKRGGLKLVELQEDRLPPLEEFYKAPRDVLESAANLPKGKRAEILAQLGVDGAIFRTTVDYTRYPFAFFIWDALQRLGFDQPDISVVDFGCLVADYGLFFARRGARVTLCDSPQFLPYAEFRFKREGLAVTACSAPADYRGLFAGKDLAIFGEVLEHLDDPLSLLTACRESGVRFIYTSHYPFGDDEYFALSDHRKGAQEQQNACLQLLRANFREISLIQEAKLWVPLRSGSAAS